MTNLLRDAEMKDLADGIRCLTDDIEKNDRQLAYLHNQIEEVLKWNRAVKQERAKLKVKLRRLRKDFSKGETVATSGGQDGERPCS